MPAHLHDMHSPSIDAVLADPAASHWLKSALQSALARDVVDAVADATVLLQLLEERTNALLGFGATVRS